jgi:hypothetical protein
MLLLEIFLLVLIFGLYKLFKSFSTIEIEFGTIACSDEQLHI